MSKGKKKRTLSPKQKAALAKGRAAMARKRAGLKRAKKHSRQRGAVSVLTPRVKRDTVRHMAKRRRHRRSSSSSLVRRAPGRARSLARSAAHGLSQEKHRMGAFLVAAGLGIAKSKGISIPHVGEVGEAGTLAIAGYAAKKLLKVRSNLLDHTITAAGVIAIYEATSSGNIPFLKGKEGGHTAHGVPDYDVR